MKVLSLLSRLQPGRQIYTMTPWSIHGHRDEAMAWVRVHDIDPNTSYRILILRRLRIGLFYCYRHNEHGRFFLENKVIGGEGLSIAAEQVVAERMYLRRLKLPPALEWCE